MVEGDMHDARLFGSHLCVVSLPRIFEWVLIF